MPIARGTIAVSDSGVVTATGLTSRLYTILAATVTAATPGGLVGGADGKPVKYALAAAAIDWAEWLTPAVHNKGNVTADVSINFLDGNAQKMTLVGNIGVTFTNIQDGARVTLHMIQDGTGGRTVSWPAEAKFRSGSSDATLSVGASARDLYVGHCEGGSVWFETPAKNLV